MGDQPVKRANFDGLNAPIKTLSVQMTTLSSTTTARTAVLTAKIVNINNNKNQNGRCEPIRIHDGYNRIMEDLGSSKVVITTTMMKAKKYYDDQSHSSVENTNKKKQVSTPTLVYSKRVQHLKYDNEACGVSDPPVFYEKSKQDPQNKRDGQIIKDLEEILSREGLSSNPCEREIKNVNRKNGRAKEL